MRFLDRKTIETPPVITSVRQRTGILLLTLLVIVTLDQATKWIARMILAGRPTRWLLGGLVSLQYAENQGAFMGLGSTLAPSIRLLLWIGFVSALLLVGFVMTLRTEGLSRWQVICLSLVISGGLGNLIDRLLNAGAVVDWVSVGFGPVRTGVFNVADVAITGGCLLLVLLSLRRENADDRA